MRLIRTLALSMLILCSYQPYVEATTKDPKTATPIKHLVVIFQENRSFDHYFGTYPRAANLPGEPKFVAAPNTPSINGLSETLLKHNPNLVQPFRLDRKHALTCDHSHEYVAEQQAFNKGLMDQFEQKIAVYKSANTSRADVQFCPKDYNGKYTIVMGHFDGNTLTTLWNSAQQYALSDNSFGTTFGPSTVGAINLVFATNSGVLCGPKMNAYGNPVVYGDVPLCGPKGAPPLTSNKVASPRGKTTGTNIGDPNPLWDVCSNQDASTLMALGNRNIGTMLTEANISWGFFQAGFTLSENGSCDAAHVRSAYDREIGVDPAKDKDLVKDYIPHHNPFQYYRSTSNPQHLEPSSVAMVGKTDQANHLYDINWFWKAADAGNVPAVSILRGPAYQDGHAGYSDPLDEDEYLRETLERLKKLPAWNSMAIIIAYDDGGGWYDHVMPPIVNHSNTTLDFGCGTENDGPAARCGYGPRLPLLLISPYAKRNYVSHQLTDQTSITRFIEDNWLQGERISETSFDNIAGSLEDLMAY